MTTIRSSAQVASALSDLTTTDADAGIGIHLNWTIPTIGNLGTIQIWVSNTNNRHNAILADTVSGNHYLFTCTSNQNFYFWIRGVTRQGAANGAFYPTGITSGVLGRANELQISTAEQVYFLGGTGVFIEVSEVIIENFKSIDDLVNITFNSAHLYPGTSVQTTYELRVYDYGTSIETVIENYGLVDYKQATMTYVVMRYNIIAGQKLAFRLYWKGEDNDVVLQYARAFVNWTFNQQ